jgi:hypothetical protein
MESHGTLLDVVFFSLPRESERLCEWLQSERLVWIHQRDDERLVAASLNAEPDDLSSLLRSVQSWAGEQNLARVPFELDGRTYTLRCNTLAFTAGA